MRTINEGGIAFELLPEEVQKEMKEADGQVYTVRRGGWTKIDDAGWFSGSTYKVELPDKKLSDEPWVNDWARWRAVDKDGVAYEYEVMPQLLAGVFESNELYDQIKGSFDTSDWQNSLEERIATSPFDWARSDAEKRRNKAMSDLAESVVRDIKAKDVPRKMAEAEKPEDWISMSHYAIDALVGRVNWLIDQHKGS